MLQLVLFQPDIPQNAGTMLRMCACLGIETGLVGPAGFPVTDRHFRRAGLDYLDALAIVRYRTFAEFETARRHPGIPAPMRRLVLLTTAADGDYLDFRFAPNDMVMVGRETAGVPAPVHEAADARLSIAMATGMRSLNVAVSAAMVVGEALRQLRPAAGLTSTRR